MKTLSALTILSFTLVFSAPLHAEKESKKNDLPAKKQKASSEAEIINEVERIEKDLNTARKKTLDAIGKKEAAEKDLQAQKKTARELEEKADELLKSLEAIQKSRLAAKLETHRKTHKGYDDKNMPSELNEASKTFEILRLKLDETYKAREVEKQLEKIKTELAKTKSANEKAEAAARDTRKQASETQTKLADANRAIEAQLKTIFDLKKEAKANTEALENRDAQIKKLRENRRTPDKRPNKQADSN